MAGLSSRRGTPTSCGRRFLELSETYKRKIDFIDSAVDCFPPMRSIILVIPKCDTECESVVLLMLPLKLT